MSFKDWVNGLAREEVPRSAELIELVESIMKTMKIETFERSKKFMDWCPLVLKQLAIRYICRSECLAMPVKETDWFVLKTPGDRKFWHCPVCGHRFFFSKSKEYTTRSSPQLLIFDMPSDNTALTQVDPLSDKQQNLFDLMKCWTHKEYFVQLIREDLREEEVEHIFYNMVLWSNKEGERITRLPKELIRVVAPQIVDGASKIVVPDEKHPLTLAPSQVGTEVPCFKLPQAIFEMKPWTNEQVDDLLDGLLYMFDVDKAESIHWQEQCAGKEKPLKPGQKRAMATIREHHKRYSGRARLRLS